MIGKRGAAKRTGFCVLTLLGWSALGLEPTPSDHTDGGKTSAGQSVGPGQEVDPPESSSRVKPFMLPQYFNIVGPTDGKGAPAVFGSLTKATDIRAGLAVYSHPDNGSWTPNGGFGYRNRPGVRPRTDLIVIAQDPRTGAYLAGYIPAGRISDLKTMTSANIIRIIKGDSRGGVQAPLTIYPPDRGSNFGTASLGTKAELAISENITAQTIMFPGVAQSVGASPLVPRDLKNKLNHLDERARVVESVALVLGARQTVSSSKPHRPTSKARPTHGPKSAEEGAPQKSPESKHSTTALPLIAGETRTVRIPKEEKWFSSHSPSAESVGPKKAPDGRTVYGHYLTKNARYAQSYSKDRSIATIDVSKARLKRVPFGWGMTLDAEKVAALRKEGFDGVAFDGMGGPEIAIINEGVMGLEGRNLPIPAGLSGLLEGRRPIPVSAIEIYHVTLPDGYVREGDRYVFVPP